MSADAYARGMEHLVGVVQALSLAADLGAVVDVVRKAARALTGADGATFVLRDGNLCHYVDEDAIGPLWRGKRFPMSSCVSGWAMQHAEPVVLEDVYQDPRIPADAYRPTFVKSLVMVPIRQEAPIGAIGTYWATHRRAEPHEVKLLQSLAHSTSVALRNVELVRTLKTALTETTAARDELQRQLALRDEFLSLAAHELRTPLTAINARMHVLHKAVAGLPGGGPQQKLDGSLRAVARQVADLGKLAEDMLDASRASLGRLVVKPQDGVDLAELVRAAATELRARRPCELDLRLQDDVTGCWDPARLRELVGHLVDNAVKFGGGQPVVVTTSRDGPTAHILVRDRGVGIAPDAHARIFGRFERAADATSFRGLGLGLYLARAIVEAHGGEIAIDSRPGQGTCVTITLPVA